MIFSFFISLISFLRKTKRWNGIEKKRKKNSNTAYIGDYRQQSIKNSNCAIIFIVTYVITCSYFHKRIPFSTDFVRARKSEPIESERKRGNEGETAMERDGVRDGEKNSLHVIIGINMQWNIEICSMRECLLLLILPPQAKREVYISIFPLLTRPFRSTFSPCVCFLVYNVYSLSGCYSHKRPISILFLLASTSFRKKIRNYCKRCLVKRKTALLLSLTH